MRFRPLLAGAAALALALSLTACGDDGDDDATDTADTEAEASDDTASDDTAADETEDTTDDTAAEEEPTDDTTAEGETGDLSALLLTPEDVGAGFVEQPYETATGEGPCGVDIDAENPFDAIVGVVITEPELGLGLQHELRTYADADAAGATFAAAQEALSCGAETTDPAIVLGEVTDVTEQVGAEAFAVPITAEAEGVEGGFITVLVGPVVSVYQLQGPAEVEEGPDPVAIVAANVEALQAELG